MRNEGPTSCPPCSFELTPIQAGHEARIQAAATRLSAATCAADGVEAEQQLRALILARDPEVRDAMESERLRKAGA